MKWLQAIANNKKKILYGLLGILIIMQFFRIDKTNPPADPALDFVNLVNPPEDISSILKNACYDCHSYHTKYPWYTNIAPISWWIKDHIDHGRGKLNFSEWGTYSQKKKDHKIEECVEFVEGEKMPLLSYMVAHGEAWISAEERSALVSWFKTL